jgi:ATP-dependent protease HslVU (ClpYQ) peptidase subunit
MTCIVAIAKDGVVYMGADSGGSDEENGTIFTYLSPKVFSRNGYLIGYAGSYRFGKLLEYVFELPVIPSKANTPEALDKFVNGTLMPSLRKQSKELDLNADELDFDCIFGINGHLFEVCNDWFALEPSIPYLSTGSGMKYALGSLHTTQGWKDPVKRINAALQSAAEYSMTVSAPFNILSR